MFLFNAFTFVFLIDERCKFNQVSCSYEKQKCNQYLTIPLFFLLCSSTSKSIGHLFFIWVTRYCLSFPAEFISWSFCIHRFLYLDLFIKALDIRFNIRFHFQNWYNWSWSPVLATFIMINIRWSQSWYSNVSQYPQTTAPCLYWL